MAQRFHQVYEVPASGADATPEFFDVRFLDIDQRFHALETLSVSWQGEINRLQAISYEQIGTLFQDAADLLNAYASLGTILSASSTSTNTVGLGAKTFIVAEADRSKVPSAAYIAVTPAGVSGVSMGGFMTSWNPHNGELIFSATTEAGAGTYSDWIIGLAAPDLNAQGGSVAANGVSIQAVDGLDATTVQDALEEIKTGSETADTALDGRVTALEEGSGPDLLPLAYAQFTGS